MNTVLLSLDLMWKGMVSIFVVIGVICIVTYIVTHAKKEKKQE